MKFTEEQLNALLKFIIGITFCVILVMMASLSMYSVVFVTQPMSGMAPADKQFFLILSDMSKYILGSLATLLAVKGKDAIAPFVPPGLSTAAEREDKPTPKVPTVSPQPARMEPTITSYNPKAAPEQPPHPEIT